MKHFTCFSFVLLLMALSLAATGCAANPHFDPAKPHHTSDGFRNNHPHRPHGGFWKWRWEKFWSGLPREPEGGYHPVVLKPTREELRTNPAVTWIGHATLLLRLGEVTVLTDPQFSERASPFSFVGPKRRVPPALPIAELPHVDAVIISHNHYDHLDEASVKALNRQPGGPPRFFVPLGMKAWFAERDITNVVELDWWKKSEHMGLTFNFTPTQHFTRRGLFNTNEVLWGGWVVEYPTFRFYFAGDTGYSPDFREIGRRHGPIDLAAIPIGAYEPRWFMGAMHVNPEEAVKIHQDVGARYSVAMHWGTFQLTDETIDDPPKRLAAALDAAGIPPERFFIMKHGEVRNLDPLLVNR
jgi:L-ascorbate metabolism protein UlaG (beta-lactamase superfamily)